METEIETLSQRANQIFINCYEATNYTNCYGYMPMKNNGIAYLMAKRYMLKLCKKHKDTELYNYTKENL